MSKNVNAENKYIYSSAVFQKKGRNVGIKAQARMVTDS